MTLRDSVIYLICKSTNRKLQTPKGLKKEKASQMVSWAKVIVSDILNRVQSKFWVAKKKKKKENCLHKIIKNTASVWLMKSAMFVDQWKKIGKLCRVMLEKSQAI